MSGPVDQTEVAEVINRHLRVANILIRQAVELMEKSDLKRATRANAGTVAIDSQLIGDLQLSTAALRRAWSGASQT